MEDPLKALKKETYSSGIKSVGPKIGKVRIPSKTKSRFGKLRNLMKMKDE